MRSPALLFVVSVFLTIFRISFCYNEGPWQPVIYDYYHIDLSELGGHHGHGHYDGKFGLTPPGINHHGSKIPIPRDVIVDVVNELGIKLLAIHNEHNENNIAISPYGAFSVLTALTEGLQGDAAHEILDAAHIPKDKHILRVGLRDIHRHLKSYFIPEEGFLAGLTLNFNNITLRSEYEDVLHFYGFDYGSFNNALYPEPPTTKKPAEGTTLHTGLTISEETTLKSVQKTEEITTEILTSKIGGSSSEKNIEQPATTTESQSTVMSTILSTTVDKETTLTTFQPSQAVTTTELSKTTELTTTQKPETTTGSSPATTVTPAKTSKSIITETSTVKEATTTAEVITKMPETTTTLLETTTKIIETTTKLPESTTTITSTSKDITTETASIPTIISKLPETTSTEAILITTINTVRTTRDVTTNLPENQLSTVSTTEGQATKILTEADIVTTETEIPTTLQVGENQLTTVSSTEGQPATILTEANIVTTETEIPTTFGIGDQVQDLETTPFVFETTQGFQEMPQNTNFDFNYNNYDVNNVPPVYDENNVVPNPPEVDVNNNFKRQARSVVDYVIARFNDDHHHYAVPPRSQYTAQEPLTFAIYGKFRESGINFMKFDTVLPYFYVQNLRAIALSFPLDSSKYYLLLLLPLGDNGVDQLICDLRLHGNLRYIIDNLKLTHVIATIPSFMLKGYVTLTPALQRLGIRKIFEPRQANFSPMTNVSDIYVTNIEQAVTVTIRNYLDPSSQHYKNFQQYPPDYFKADHPFLYFVIDSELHVALMIGKVVNPLNSRIRQWFGDEKPPSDLGDPIDFESGPFLDYAIAWVYIFKKFLIPRDYRMKAGNVRCVAICEKINKKKKQCKT